MARHGLQMLPDTLPIVDFERARPYRSRRNRTVEAAQLDQQRLLEMARGFTLRGRNPALPGWRDRLIDQLKRD